MAIRLTADEWQLQPPFDLVMPPSFVYFHQGALAMMTVIKLLNLRKPPTHLDDHLLRDLGLSRIDSQFAAHAESARTFLDNWIAQHVTDNASPDKKSAMKLVVLCVKDAKEKGITRAELEKAAGEDLTDCIVDAQLAGAEARMDDLFE
jgi:hypothetical protein